jgi:hypothetical protein
LEVAELRPILISSASPSPEAAVVMADVDNEGAEFSIFTPSINPIDTPAMAEPVDEFLDLDES